MGQGGGPLLLEGVLEQLGAAELLGPGDPVISAGTAAGAADPAEITARLVEAVRTGTPLRMVAGRLARLAALAGDADTALRLADHVLADAGAPDRDVAVSVAAAVLAGRGLLNRSAELHRWHCARTGCTDPAAVPALLGTGDLAGAHAMLRPGVDPPAAHAAYRPPTAEAGVALLVAQGLLDSVTGAPSAALSKLARAARLLEPTGRATLTADSPAALTAVVAVNCGEFAVAESVLARALHTDLGGGFARARHRLLAGWIAMQRGDLDRARRFSQTPGDSPLEPREELMAAAIEVGIARRAGDLGTLMPAWQRARQAIVRHPVDLYCLHPLGELAVAAARLDEERWIAPHLQEAWTILDSLGSPTLWAAPLHWYGVQAAVMASCPEQAAEHLRALSAAASNAPQAAVFAAASHCWLDVLAGDIDAASVISAAKALHSIGQAWDASRLAGQAAVRAGDRTVMATLLNAARALRPTVNDTDDVSETMAEPARGEPIRARAERAFGVPAVPLRQPEAAGAEAPPAPRGTSSARIVDRGQDGLALSEREREVARLLVDGLTHKEIGARLFISAKTVEHHIARIRHRSGAATRGELFSRLRAELATG